MKTKSLLSLFCVVILFHFSYTQQIIQTSIGNINRTTPKIGFNSNGHFPSLNWTQQAFIDSTVELNAEVFRYPGGTNANYWDWQTGWWKPPYGPPIIPMTIRPEEFQVGLNATNTDGLFVLNYLTSDVNEQMAGLRHINSLGMNLNYIEIGNEHNLTSTTDPTQFIPPSIYGQGCVTFCDSIKNTFPNAKICLVGGAPPATSMWHDSILYFNPKMDAFAWHVYPDANNVDLIFDVNRALSIPFSYLPNRYSAAKFNTLPSNIDVWVTEYNLWETQFSSAPVIAETWTHALYVTAMNNYFLSVPKITMMINHSLASNGKYYQSINDVDHHITANGVAMRLLSDMCKGSQNSQNISFTGNPSITYGNTSFPKLIGWKFNFTAEERGFICNFSKDTFIVSLQSVFSNPMTFDTYSADTNFVVSGKSSLNLNSGTSVDQITILPYSITQISSATINSVNEISSLEKLLIYPNPANHNLSLSKAIADFSITNAVGQIILSSNEKTNNIPTDNFKNGVYFLKIDNQCVRFIVQH